LRLFALLVTSAYVTKRPDNVVAVLGTKVKFNCASNQTSRVRWDFYKVALLFPVLYGTEFQHWQPFSVDQRQPWNSCDLTAEKVTWDLAGAYVCREERGHEVFGTLTLLGETALFAYFNPFTL
jgi:hypothetical protein